MTETLEEVLAHYGIKGMKWGVRRKRGSDGTVGGDSDKELSDDAANALSARQKARKQGTQALSNKELQDLVTRIDLEKKYAKTFGESEKKEGKKFVRELLREESKRQVRSVVSAAATVAVAQALAKAAAKNSKPFVSEVAKKFG